MLTSTQQRLCKSVCQVTLWRGFFWQTTYNTSAVCSHQWVTSVGSAGVCLSACHRRLQRVSHNVPDRPVTKRKYLLFALKLALP